MKAFITDIKRFAVHDGPGIRTTVFFKGCPLKCIWCHNPESLEKAPAIAFSKKNCTLCGNCLEVCGNRKIENGILKINRTACIRCGKCTEICLNNANELIGREMTASEVFDEVIKDKMFYDTSGGGLTVTGGEPSYQPEFTSELLSLAKAAGVIPILFLNSLVKKGMLL